MRKIRYIVEMGDMGGDNKLRHCNLVTCVTDLLHGTRVSEQWHVYSESCGVLPDMRCGYGMGLSNIFLKARPDNRLKVKANIRRVLNAMVKDSGKLFLACDGEILGCEA